ncbi:MAG: hypothetical protein Q8807_03265 ['Waltheria sp.' little leaf phytoplasma]|nr:hypothetical protein ['Waltheria sp.' little leaf phytoplasma]
MSPFPRKAALLLLIELLFFPKFSVPELKVKLQADLHAELSPFSCPSMSKSTALLHDFLICSSISRQTAPSPLSSSVGFTESLLSPFLLTYFLLPVVFSGEILGSEVAATKE